MATPTVITTPSDPASPTMSSASSDTFFQRGWNKCKQQPFVPLGAAVTVWALVGAVREFKRGNSQNVNRFLRFRVVAQGATVAAMLIGSVVYERTAAAQKEQDLKAERERMFRILDSVGESPVESTPTIPSLPDPVVAPHETSTPRASKVNAQAAEPRRRGAQYVGSNDQWKEYFDQKNKTSGAIPPSQPAADPPSTTTPQTKSAWSIWR